jgi:hypothetical protein
MKTLYATCLTLGIAAVAVWAQDPAPAEPAAPAALEAESAPPAAEAADGQAIPAPYPVSRYEAAWAKNPFMRKTVAIVQEKESVLKDWALNGMAEYDGKIRVTMVNKQTGEYKHVTNQDGPDADFRLIQANFNRNRADASAEIEKGGEKATIKYDENLTSKPLTVVNTQRQTQGAQGQAGQVPPGGVRQGVPVSATGAPPVAAGGVRPLNTPVPPPGAVNAAPGASATGGVTGSQPPSISRRRQLVPVPPPPAQTIPAQQ